MPPAFPNPYSFSVIKGAGPSLFGWSVGPHDVKNAMEIKNILNTPDI